jgi:hypothetical protein
MIPFEPSPSFLVASWRRRSAVLRRLRSETAQNAARTERAGSARPRVHAGRRAARETA